MVAAGTADTEEDIFTTQATTATAVAGVTTAVASIHGGYCRSLSRFRILPTADTDMVPVPATADTGRAMVPGTVTGTESRTRTGLGVQNLDPVSIPVSPAHADGSGETATQRHVQDQLGDRGRHSCRTPSAVATIRTGFACLAVIESQSLWLF